MYEKGMLIYEGRHGKRKGRKSDRRGRAPPYPQDEQMPHAHNTVYHIIQKGQKPRGLFL